MSQNDFSDILVRVTQEKKVTSLKGTGGRLAALKKVTGIDLSTGITLTDDDLLTLGGVRVVIGYIADQEQG